MEELLAALRPDDLASWSVYADFLQTKGDPRGELLSMMLQREQQPTPRLFDAQRRFLAKHAAALVPAGQTAPVWRRGFVTEHRIESPEQLSELAEPLLRFVDMVTLAIDGEVWEDWTAALAKQTWAWRSLVVELVNPPEQLELAPLFACCPAVETARFKLPEDEAVELVWDNVRAPALRRLVIVNPGRVAKLEVELPALRELWIIGESDVDESVSLRWQALERLVLADSYRARDDDDYYEAHAFMILGQPIELALIRKLVAQMTSITRLSVRIGELWWLRRPVTVLSLHGDQDPYSQLPYSLGIALENVLAKPPPMVLVEIDETRGQFLALGTDQVRGQLEASRAELVRRAFDVTFGCDPGSTIVDDILDALAAAPEHVLVGVAGGRLLNIIDPRATPLDDPDAEPYDDEEDEDEEYEGWDDDGWDDLQTQYEEPIPLAKVIVKTDADALIELYGDVEVENDDDEVIEDEDIFYATDEVLDRPEAWFEFRDNWDDRALAPDDEPGDVRWPDPAHAADDQNFEPDRQVAQPACAEHGPYDTCNWCGATVCWSCADTRLDGVCASCIVELEHASLPDAVTRASTRDMHAQWVGSVRRVQRLP